MSGMVPRNHGTIGTYFPDALYRNLECRYFIDPVHWTVSYFLAGRVIQAFVLLIIGLMETRQNDILSLGMLGTMIIVLNLT